MFSSHSLYSSSSSIDTQKEMSSSASSIYSATSFETEKSTEKIFSTIDIIPSADEPLEPREGLRKRARHHFRSFCRHKSPKAVSATTGRKSFSYAVLPPSVAFPNPAEVSANFSETNQEKARETALIIDCNKPTSRIQHTIENALHTFPKENIFVVGNGNSDCPINNASRICTWFGVRHIWIPTRSKVAAQYVGVAAAHRFKYCLLIDEDIALPETFPIATELIENHGTGEKAIQTPVKCIGYALEAASYDDDQVLNLDYQLSSLPMTFFGKSGEVGSASFPHGTVTLWDRSLLQECFQRHPGYRTSPNWFLGINLALTLQRTNL